MKLIGSKALAQVENPFDSGISKYVFEYQWISYTFGSLFVVLGFLLFLDIQMPKQGVITTEKDN